MNPTKTLPPDYKPLYTLDLTKNIGVAIFLNIAVVIMFVGFGRWFALLSMRLRPELWKDWGQITVSDIDLLSLGIAFVLMVVLHEGIHGLSFWLVTREPPKFGVKLLYAFASAPDWYIPRNQFIAVGLAPLVLLSILGVVLMPLFPLNWTPGLIFFLTFNAAGSVGDLLTVFILFYRPKDVLVNDLGDSFTIYGVEEELPPMTL